MILHVLIYRQIEKQKKSSENLPVGILFQNIFSRLTKVQDEMRDVAGYLTTQIEATLSNEELSGLWRQLKDLHQRRLWHQLTEVLLQLVKRPELHEGDNLWQLYTNVIADFEIK